MSGAVAEVRVGDLPKPVRKKLGLEGLADNAQVTLARLENDSDAVGTKADVTGVTAQDAALRGRPTVKGGVSRRRWTAAEKAERLAFVKGLQQSRGQNPELAEDIIKGSRDEGQSLSDDD